MKQNQKSKPQYSVPNNILFLVKDMAKAHPLLLVFLFLEMTLAVVSPVLNLYVPKIALDLVTQEASLTQAICTLGGIGLAMTLSMALSQMAGEGKYMMYNNMRQVYRYRMFLQHLTCDYQHIESVEGRAKYSRAIDSINWGDDSGTSQMTVYALDLFVAAASFFLYSAILSSLNAVVVIALVVLSCVNLLAVRHAQSYAHQNRMAVSKLSNQMSYVERTAGSWEWGKDIRLYGMSKWLLDLRELLLLAHTALNRKIRQRYFCAGAVNAFTLFARDTLAYGYLIYAILHGQIALGDFVLYFGAITGFSGFVGRLIDDMNALNQANLQMNDLRAFLDNTDAPDPDPAAPLPASSSLSIEFRNVSFSYSEETEPVLKDFSLSVPPGEKIALVGVNGAGKTTIIKLLCGMYKPDSGEILIDGVNIQQYRTIDLFRLFSAVFQDIFIPPFTVAENVSMQLLEHTDMDRVNSCLEKAGLLPAIQAYPDGVCSYMLKEIHDGIVLSGGQQQKLLMARALYKDAPILILDEPTAALDPIAESETYEHFHKLSQDKTAIYISHRLASTRFCDRIVLLSDGVAAEVGTHEELLALGGIYSEMYALQSQYYKEEGGASYA